MAQRFYDTRTAQIRDFEPLVPGEASVYYCGATVQGMPHVGHVRSAIVFDILIRWLEATGLRVTSVRNVTDIDDKILDRSAASHEAGFEASDLYPAREPWWALAYRFEKAFDAAYLALGVRRPTYEPRATGHVPEMFALIERLMERGHAYPAQDGSGDVYFDVRSWERYGELTRQRVEDMQDAPDADPRGKRDPRDFALWKGAKPGEPATAVWESPWGAGRPGWHLECSAMSTKYLGAEFDIHGGGLDLRFPHHENELAQSAAAGDGFARFWLHNGLVTYGGEKMSKSVGNTISPEEMLGMARPTAVRYFLGQAHYRSQLDYRPGALDEAEATRVDVGADTFTGTGTVEVARLTGQGRQDVERHIQTVNALRADCREMTMTVQEGDATVDYRLEVSDAPLSDGTPAQSALVWERTLASESEPQLTAQVLTAVTSDAVVMVSFVGRPEAGRKEFTLIAEEMLAAALAAD